MMTAPFLEIFLLTALLAIPAFALGGSDSGTTSKVRPGETLTGDATVYPNVLNGHKTSSGETFHQAAHTAASNQLPLRTHVKVTNLKNGRSTDVKVIDRGPKLGKRKIDLSKKAANEIGLTHQQGKVPVKIHVTSTPAASTTSSASR